jgi:RHS repeat-associated protein
MFYKTGNSFGSPLFGRTYQAETSVKYRFAFNGKEKDDETYQGSLAYELRILDSRIGRWLSTDPRENEYAWQSTYAYFSNSPISTLDFYGGGGPYQETEANAPTTDGSSQKTINIFVSPANPDKNLKASLKKAEKAAKNSGGSLVVIKNVLDLKDLNSKLSEVTNNGEIKIQNLIFDSHGKYDNDQFKIGSTEIKDGTGKGLEGLKKYLTDNSNVILLACHAGGNGDNDKNGSLVENLSKTFDCTVYGCKSWTGVVGLFGGKTNVSQANPERFEDGQQPNAWKYLGQWKMASCGVVITIVNGISLTSTGGVVHKENPSKLNNAMVSTRKVYTDHLTDKQRGYINKAAKQVEKIWRTH